jgi:hypothetical protein
MTTLGSKLIYLIIVYTKLGIGWASSLLGFIAVALLPVPWLFFVTGHKLRRVSRFETADI